MLADAGAPDEEVARHFRLGCAAGPVPDAVLAASATAFVQGGRLRDAERLSRELLARAPDRAPADAARLALVAALRGQRRPTAVRAEVAVLLAERDVAPATRARLRAELARALLACGDPDEAARVAATVPDADPEACGTSRSVLSLVGSGWGRAGLAVDLASDALRRAPGSEVAHHALAAALLRADRVAEAELLLARARRSALDRAPFDDLDAILRFRTGAWTEPGRDGAGASSARRAAAAMIAVHRNRLDLADRLLAADPAPPDPHGHWPAWARAQCAEARGRPRDALHQLRAAWTAATRAGLAVDYPLLGPDLVRLLLAAGERAAARDAAAQVAEIAVRGAAPSAGAASARCTAQLHDDPEAALRAIRILDGGPFVPAWSQACEQAAATPGAADPAALLRQARSGFRTLGARRDLARVDARLRALGVRRGAGRRRAPTGRGWSGLTDAERSVVDLAVGGLTNREIAERLFVSPRTVETHLTHVYAKLGVRGRSALRTAAARQPETYGVFPDVRDVRPAHDRAPQLAATEGDRR